MLVDTFIRDPEGQAEKGGVKGWGRTAWLSRGCPPVREGPLGGTVGISRFWRGRALTLALAQKGAERPRA